MDEPGWEGQPTCWRSLNPQLCVGYRGTRALGTIECGRWRYTWLDRDGAPHGVYATLQDAQEAAAADPSRAAWEEPGRWCALALTLGLISMTVLATAWALRGLLP